MTACRTAEHLAALVNELRKQPKETEWIEFKCNRAVPKDIGEYISALANSAALVGRTNAYMVWGIDDDTHDIVGTDFDPSAVKKGNEDLENWLLRLMTPKIDFRFYSFLIAGKRIVLLEVGAASRQPVRFEGQEFIRVGSYKKKLKEFPEKERALWRVFDTVSFERIIAVENVSAEEVLSLLDYSSYFDFLELPLPDGHAVILDSLARDGLIRSSETAGWNITNLGAILFAKKLDLFPKLKRKAVRVIQYKGSGKLEPLREQVGGKGYAAGFEGLIDFIKAIVPKNEVIGQALRQEIPMFPDLAVRELVVNALGSVSKLSQPYQTCRKKNH
jgi:predicted HTH transcriptional regulator